MNAYIEKVMDGVRAKNANEPEFIQAVQEVLSSISPVIDQHPEFEKANILARIVEPERQISFRVTWVDDEGNVQVNTGYRVQFNSAIGPYKGGIRFAPSVYLGIIKFLAFEQTFKNSLTGLPLGGGKGGSDFNPIGKSDGEIMRFCQAFMAELFRYIGPDVDVPAGDIGVGKREVGYMFGMYKKLRNAFKNGVFTGKGLTYGGSLIRPEATGFGGVYYTREILNHFGDDIKGKTVALSGYGNVTWGTTLKLAELGAKPVTISGIPGFVYDEEGITTPEKINHLLYMRENDGDNVLIDYANKFGAKFFPNEKPWRIKTDIAMPCATQNEVNLEDAKRLVENGTQYYIELSNMPTQNDALEYLKENLKAVGPSKAANAGGVAVSALEMAQNSQRISWTAEEVDQKLQNIMKNIHDETVAAAKKYGLGYDLIAGANIYGFIKVAQAMLEQGVI